MRELRLVRFASVLATLLVAHNVGDHVVQTDHQAGRKAADWGAMVGHVGGYTVTAAVALRVVRPGVGWWRALLGLVFSAGTHAFIDRRWPVLWVLRRTGSAGFAEPVVRVWFGVDGDGRPVGGRGVPREVQAEGPLPIHGPYVADQALHHGCLLIAALIMAGGRRKDRDRMVP